MQYLKDTVFRSKKRVADSVRITESEGKDIEEDMDGDITSTASGAEINSGLQIKTRTFLHKYVCLGCRFSKFQTQNKCYRKSQKPLKSKHKRGRQ